MGWGGGEGWEGGFCYTIRNLKMHSNSPVSWVGLLFSTVIEHETVLGRCACIQVCREGWKGWWKGRGRGGRGGMERGGSDTADKT